MISTFETYHHVGSIPVSPPFLTMDSSIKKKPPAVDARQPTKCSSSSSVCLSRESWRIGRRLKLFTTQVLSKLYGIIMVVPCGFQSHGDTPNSWMVYLGKSINKWMIWGYPHDLGNHLGSLPPYMMRMGKMIDSHSRL